ncbi:Major facilitator superfamily domain, general substrate transporter [Pseudocohnilembus persalinus]|uniref:Lysosomal dipeptide transporter MFSD1 n=1 Tax=Pseudocohnilembus persalinus TaxID=266149 RepID=A0A0V0QPF5_PSEPJ|nr:Major facilitator superfamily domain, general substrate transporter [Pseudocohnilembus persalinus]|eukprot:KRX04239.1 Major facilitator superfamily domain, general substrate transporter [Pseudocohnilembus persalinus]
MENKIQNESLQESSYQAESTLIQEQSVKHHRKYSHVDSFKKSKWRWIQLILISIFNFVCLYGIQVPTPLQEAIEKSLDINPNQYNMMQAWFCIPNIILPLLAGPLSFKVGIKPALFIYGLLMTIGQLIEWLAVRGLHGSYTWSLIGIIIFGIGSNGGVVLINAFACQWFFGKELSMALALGNAIQYLGQLAASILLPYLSELEINKQEQNGSDGEHVNSLNSAYFISLLIIGFGGLLSVLGMYILDNKAEKYDKKNNVKPFVEEEDHKISIKDFKKVFKFGKLFWIVQSMTFFAYICLCYNNNIDGLLEQNYAQTNRQSGYYMALQFIIQLPLTPLLGYYTDLKGKRSLLAIIGGILNVAQFVIFMVVPTCEDGTCSSANFIVPLAIGGVANSFFGAVFQAMVALTVPKKDLEISFGVLDGVMQLGNSVGPLLQGPILNNTTKENGFYWFFVQNLITGLIQLGLSVWIFFYDRVHGKLFEVTEDNEMESGSSNEEEESSQLQKEKDLLQEKLIE